MRKTPASNLAELARLLGFGLLILATPLRAQSRGALVAGPAVKFDSAAVSVRSVSPQSLATLMADKDFLYDRKPSPPATLWQETEHWFWRQIKKLFFSRESEAFWKILPYLVAVAALVFAVTRLLKTDIRSLFYNTGACTTGYFHEVAEDIHQLDFDRLIEEQIQKQQYRAAVRLYYLKLLQQLTGQGLIAWKIDKTNYEYLQELRQDELKTPFARLTLLFEHIWYGEFALDEAAFRNAASAFQNFSRQLAQA